VVHLVLIEARNLKGADTSLLGGAHSDPYCIVQGCFLYSIWNFGIEYGLSFFCFVKNFSVMIWTPIS